MSAMLRAVVERAGLRAVGQQHDDEQPCVYDARWPGRVFGVTAGSPELSARLEAAADDVEDLWPGRDHNDGALSLLAISLQSALDGRTAPPVQVYLSTLQWVVEPADTPAGPATVESEGDLVWRAADRRR